MKITNPNFGFKPWRKQPKVQRFMALTDSRTGFILYYPKQLRTPPGERVEKRVLDFMVNVTIPETTPR